MNTYVILHRVLADHDHPSPVVIRADRILAVTGDSDGNTRLYFEPRSFWTVAEDEETVLISLGFFDPELTPRPTTVHPFKQEV